MGTRVAFRPRARNCVIADGDTVSYLEPRVKFQKGWLTGGTDPADGSVEVGDGTLYPMEITADELFEIYYGVKDCSITSGAIALDGFGGITTYTLQSSGISRPTALFTTYDVLYDEISMRGYCAVSDDIAPDIPIEHVSTDLFGTTYYPSWSIGPPDPAVRDILDVEAAMWVNGDSPAPRDEAFVGRFGPSRSFPDFNVTAARYASTMPSFRTAFNQAFLSSEHDAASPQLYGLYVENSGGVNDVSEFTMYFTGEVAFIDNAGNGNPFDPANTLYAGFVFRAYEAAGASFMSTESEGPSYAVSPSMTATGFDVDLVLSSSTVSCPIYFMDDDSSGISDAPFTINSGSSSNIVVTADEWWPYAKPDGTDKWNTATGAYIP